MDTMKTDETRKKEAAPTGTDSGVLGQAKQAAQTVMGQTKEQLETQIAAKKEAVTDRVDKVASALREAGTKLGEEQNDQKLTGYASQAADQVERLSSYVRSRNIGQIIGDVEGFARREPAIFLGGSFVLGVFAARFLKSSGHRVESPRGDPPAPGDFGGRNDAR